MASPKLFAQYIETATATDNELCERHLKGAYQEREPKLREQRVLETRSWHDAGKVTCRKP